MCCSRAEHSCRRLLRALINAEFLWIASGLASLALLQPPALLLVCYRTLARLFQPSRTILNGSRSLIVSSLYFQFVASAHSFRALESYTTKMAKSTKRLSSLRRETGSSDGSYKRKRPEHYEPPAKLPEVDVHGILFALVARG